MTQCTAVTNTGKRCRRNAVKGKSTCAQHAKPKVKKQPAQKTKKAAAAAAPKRKPAAATKSKTAAAAPIKFYEINEPYYEFTNFATGYPFDLDGKRWPTSEHYFQAQKFPKNPSYQEIIRNRAAPRMVFNYARSKDAEKKT